MDETPRLFDVDTQPARKRPEGAAYICPQCWQRIYLLLPPEEPPLCDPCGEKMIPLRGVKKPAPPPKAPTAEPEEKPGLL